MEKQKDHPENEQAKSKSKKIPIWAWVLLLIALLIALFVFWPTSEKGYETDQTTEQTDTIVTPPPAPVVIEVQKVDRVITLSNLTEKQKALLVKTTTPDLKGENVLLVYRISDPLIEEMYWIQTDPGDGTVRNIFTYAQNVIVKN